jgi:peptidoglycan/xylan/chitin deacetylase (PgdA/CDA1 family)
LELGYRFVPAAELADTLVAVPAGPGAPPQSGAALAEADAGHPTTQQRGDAIDRRDGVIDLRDDVVDLRDGDRRLAVTFDDGVRTVATQAAPVLQRYGIPWSVFVVTDWASGKHRHADLLLNWDEIARLASEGAVIGSHSVTHPDLGSIAVEAARDEIETSKAVIAERTGIVVTEFAVPLGQSSNWRPEVAALAADAGFEHVYAQSEHRRPPGTVARTFVTRYDTSAVLRAALGGAFDDWEEWY